MTVCAFDIPAAAARTDSRSPSLHQVRSHLSLRHLRAIRLSLSSVANLRTESAPDPPSEWITGCRALNTSNWLHLWVYLFFMNMMYAIPPSRIPLLSRRFDTPPPQMGRDPADLDVGFLRLHHQGIAGSKGLRDTAHGGSERAGKA